MVVWAVNGEASVTTKLWANGEAAGGDVKRATHRRSGWKRVQASGTTKLCENGEATRPRHNLHNFCDTKGEPCGMRMGSSMGEKETNKDCL
ncbi:hypothetical protein SESBI_49522 [Sesbania bispinosa]|nr:hypothetical protein SESBI_49522 [Sesbania bispinosa]